MLRRILRSGIRASWIVLAVSLCVLPIDTYVSHVPLAAGSRHTLVEVTTIPPGVVWYFVAGRGLSSGIGDLLLGNSPGFSRVVVVVDLGGHSVDTLALVSRILACGKGSSVRALLLIPALLAVLRRWFVVIVGRRGSGRRQ